MDRFGLKKQDLPAGSRVLHDPPGLYEQYQGFFAPVLTAAVLLAALAIMALLDSLRHRKLLSRLRESEKLLTGRRSRRESILGCMISRRMSCRSSSWGSGM